MMSILIRYIAIYC